MLVPRFLLVVAGGELIATSSRLSFVLYDTQQPRSAVQENRGEIASEQQKSNAPDPDSYISCEVTHSACCEKTKDAFVRFAKLWFTKILVAIETEGFTKQKMMF